MVKYKVIVGYTTFIFDEAPEAMLFARTAKSHFLKRQYHDDDEIDVSIIVIVEKEGEEEPNE